MGALGYYRERALTAELRLAALIPVLLGVLIIALNYTGAKERNSALQGCGVLCSCCSMVLVVLGLVAAGVSYMAFHAETVPVEGCCA